MKPVFVTLEGPEGSGKSTHTKKLADYLQKKGFKVLATREPGGTDISEQIRDILLSSENKKLASKAELFLYLASRAQHLEELVKPALRKNKIVLCDRFFDATLAYQGYGRNLNKDLIKSLNDFTVGELRPDITILLDIEAEKGLRKKVRMNQKESPGASPDLMESQTKEFHERVREGYLELAKNEPERIKIVKCQKTIEATQKKIRDEIDSFLENKGIK